MEELITFGSSVFAAFIVAFMAHHLATSRMKKSDLSKFQVEAYSDFIAAVSRLAVSRSLGDTMNKLEPSVIRLGTIKQLTNQTSRTRKKLGTLLEAFRKS